MMVNDLARSHKPVTQLFAQPQEAAEWDALRLTDDQLTFFHENGYVAPVRLLNDDQVDHLLAELAGLVDPNHPGHELFYEFHTDESLDPSMVLFHALGAWRIAPGFHDLLWNPAMLVPAAQLLDGAVRFWHDQLFCKPARHGGVVAWHQDYSYWTRTKPLAHMTCWIALDDVTHENGCVQYIPGSHKWDLLPITGLAGDMDAIRSVLTEERMAQFQPVPIELKRGEATFHHALMIHGSSENRTDGPRRGTVVNLIRDGVRSASDEPPLDGVPPIPSGEPMGGTFFPLLYTPDGGR